jgi:hypothetical protein
MEGSETHTQVSLPPGVERIHAVPEFKPDVDPFLLRKLDDGTRYQVETQSVIKQQVRWLSDTVVVTHKLAIESWLDTRDLPKIRDTMNASKQTLSGMRNAPIKLIWWALGIAAHTMVTCIVTIWLTGLFKATP